MITATYIFSLVQLLQICSMYELVYYIGAGVGPCKINHLLSGSQKLISNKKRMIKNIFTQ